MVYDTDMHGVNSTGITEYSQTGPGGSPACVIVNERLPTVIEPVRTVSSLFLSTEYPTVPLPVPVPLDVTAIHPVVLTADHWHWSPVLTANVPVALSFPNDAFAGEMSIEQGAPSCLTATEWPAMVKVPVRSVVFVLAVRLTPTTPFPAPLAPLVMPIQPRSDEAVQLH
jgi:hypothetical protein